MNNSKLIIWDFDGVIINSNDVRIEGFKTVLKQYPKDLVDKFISYHNENGGLSRFVKFRYFFENLLQISVEENLILKFADEFSFIMKEKLAYKRVLILDSVKFIRNHFREIKFYIASGSEEKELNYLCEKLDLCHFFNGIFGSPQNKIDLVSKIINENDINRCEISLIGDSINDFEAANKNGISFYGYNNPSLKGIGSGYIESFQLFKL